MGKKKMNYGKVDLLTPHDLNMKKAKIRITTLIDFPIYQALKEEAEGQGIGYQTLLNRILRNWKDLACPVENEILDKIAEKVMKKMKKEKKSA